MWSSEAWKLFEGSRAAGCEAFGGRQRRDNELSLGRRAIFVYSRILSLWVFVGNIFGRRVFILGAFWGHLRAIRGHLAPSSVHLQAIWWPSLTIWDHLGPNSGCEVVRVLLFCFHLGSFWGFEAFRRVWGYGL